MPGYVEPLRSPWNSPAAANHIFRDPLYRIRMSGHKALQSGKLIRSWEQLVDVRDKDFEAIGVLAEPNRVNISSYVVVEYVRECNMWKRAVFYEFLMKLSPRRILAPLS